EHRRRGRRHAHRVPTALRRVHRVVQPRNRRARRLRLLRAIGGVGRRASGLGEHRGGEEPPRDRGERQHRVALGATHRRLRARHRRRRPEAVMATVSAETAVRARGISRPWRLLAAALLAGALLVGLGVGPVGIGVTGIVESALSHLPFLHVHSPLGSVQEAVLWQIRAPRVVLAAIVGGMLAIAGSSYQGVFHNPLADPYLLGVAAGSGLGATLAIAYGHVGTSGALLPVAAVVGGRTAVAAAYVLGRPPRPARAA